MRLQSAAVLVIILVAVAISAEHVSAKQQAALPAEVTTGEWTLVSLQSAPGAVQDTTGKGLTIQFDPSGTVYGSSGCNSFRGGFTPGAGEQVSFSPLASTQMACEQPIMDLEATYLLALEDVSGYALDGATRLQLTFDGGQGVLSYTKSQPTTLPATGGSDVTPGLLAAFGILCCIAGLWLHRRQLALSQRRVR